MTRRLREKPARLVLLAAFVVVSAIAGWVFFGRSGTEPVSPEVAANSSPPAAPEAAAAAEKSDKRSEADALDRALAALRVEVISKDADLFTATLRDIVVHRRQVVQKSSPLTDYPGVEIARIDERHVWLGNGAREGALELARDVLSRPQEARLAAFLDDPRPPLAKLSDLAQEVKGSRTPEGLRSAAHISPFHDEAGVFRGVRLNFLEPNGIYQQLGLREGDAVVEVNGYQAATEDDTERFITELTESTSLRLVVQAEDGSERTLVVSAARQGGEQ